MVTNAPHRDRLGADMCGDVGVLRIHLFRACRCLPVHFQRHDRRQREMVLCSQISNSTLDTFSLYDGFSLPNVRLRYDLIAAVRCQFTRLVQVSNRLACRTCILCSHRRTEGNDVFR